jgi:hypothetical protein
MTAALKIFFIELSTEILLIVKIYLFYIKRHTLLT